MHQLKYASNNRIVGNFFVKSLYLYSLQDMESSVNYKVMELNHFPFERIQRDSYFFSCFFGSNENGGILCGGKRIKDGKKVISKGNTVF